MRKYFSALASHREAWPLPGRPGLSQEGWASHREAGPLTGRLGLTTCELSTSQLVKKTNKNLYIYKILRYQLHANHKILDSATKQQNAVDIKWKQSTVNLKESLILEKKLI